MADALTESIVDKQRHASGTPTGAGPSTRKQESQESAANQELTVVVCDDGQAVRDRLVGILRRLQGVRIAGEAYDASSVVDLAANLKPDVLVLDLKLPDGNGMEVLRRIRAKHPSITVIILTNHAHALYRRACLEAGASYFFDKSTEFDKVAPVLSEMLARREGSARSEKASPPAHKADGSSTIGR